ncbi:hypothetical protein B0H34DRAFT_203078 [Crassisporium funariophilum]|nr:hypothetical protein B0H34DRAFT_203078 [Crassisporium funariophilum]
MSAQMPSLGQSIQAMSLQPPSRLAARTAKPDRIVVPVPKRTSASEDRRLFYGFEVSYDWLVEYCEKNAHRIISYDPTHTSIAKMFLATELLIASSKVKNLTIEGVFCRLSQPSLQLGGRDDHVPLVSVCSSMKSSYDQRPTRAQLKKLQAILQRDPDWFVDVDPSSYYTGG